MALFKIFKGAEEDLNDVPLHEGYAYFCEDTGNLFIDVSNIEGGRLQVNAYAAQVLKNNVTEIDIDDLIDEEDIVVTVTHKGYTKRLPVDTYKSQRRGGRGISGLTTREEDFVEHLFTATTHHTLLFFTTRGVVYKL